MSGCDEGEDSVVLLMARGRHGLGEAELELFAVCLILCKIVNLCNYIINQPILN
jgi:hypothetical protein